MKSLLQTMRFILSHPLTRRHKLSACWRFLKWQMGSRLLPFEVLYPFVGKTRLLIKKGMTGATGNIYVGLHEYAEMGFLLHLLRPGDIFGDIGANIGSFSILASGVARSNSVSVEPVPSTFRYLLRNTLLNDLESSIRAHNCGVGAEPGELRFTSNLDTVNHVIADGQGTDQDSVVVRITTLDDLFPDQPPVLLKIDVEGFELSVLRGAAMTLQQPGLRAIIIEINGACTRYGVQEEEIHRLLLSYGFHPVTYSPIGRTVKTAASFDPQGNTIYIRDDEWVTSRLSAAPEVRILNTAI